MAMSASKAALATITPMVLDKLQQIHFNENNNDKNISTAVSQSMAAIEQLKNIKIDSAAINHAMQQAYQYAGFSKTWNKIFTDNENIKNNAAITAQDKITKQLKAEVKSALEKLTVSLKQQENIALNQGKLQEQIMKMQQKAMQKDENEKQKVRSDSLRLKLSMRSTSSPEIYIPQIPASLLYPAYEKVNDKDYSLPVYAAGISSQVKDYLRTSLKTKPVAISIHVQEESKYGYKKVITAETTDSAGIKKCLHHYYGIVSISFTIHCGGTSLRNGCRVKSQ